MSGTYNVSDLTTVARDITFDGTAHITSLGATVTVSGGTLSLGTGQPVSIAALNLSGGALGGTDTVTIPAGGTLVWTSGNMTGSGTTAIAANAALNISTSGGKTITQRIVNHGGAGIWSGVGGVGTITLGTGAQLNVVSGGTLDLQADVGIASTTGSGTVSNAGTLTKSGGTGNSVVNVPFNNSGTVNLNSGRLQLGAVAYTQTAGTTILGGGSLQSSLSVNINGGSLTGTGAVIANTVSNAGHISPGASPGAINITGNLTLTSSSVLDIELGGTTAGSGYDQINVSGAGAESPPWLERSIYP